MSRITKKMKIFAYILHESFGYTMVEIAKIMDVSQPSISLYIREIRNEYLSTQLDLTEYKNELINLGYKEPTINFKN